MSIHNGLYSNKGRNSQARVTWGSTGVRALVRGTKRHSGHRAARQTSHTGYCHKLDGERVRSTRGEQLACVGSADRLVGGALERQCTRSGSVWIGPQHTRIRRVWRQRDRAAARTGGGAAGRERRWSEKNEMVNLTGASPATVERKLAHDHQA